MFIRYLAVTLVLFVLTTAAAHATYTATIMPQPGLDQSDSALFGTLAWHLLQADASGGGIIHLADGIYQLRQSLVLPDNVNLIGQSSKVILKAKGQQFFDHLINNLHSDLPAAPGIHNIKLANCSQSAMMSQ